MIQKQAVQRRRRKRRWFLVSAHNCLELATNTWSGLYSENKRHGQISKRQRSTHSSLRNICLMQKMIISYIFIIFIVSLCGQAAPQPVAPGPAQLSLFNKMASTMSDRVASQTTPKYRQTADSISAGSPPSILYSRENLDQVQQQLHSQPTLVIAAIQASEAAGQASHNPTATHQQHPSKSARMAAHYSLSCPHEALIHPCTCIIHRPGSTLEAEPDEDEEDIYEISPHLAINTTPNAEPLVMYSTSTTTPKPAQTATIVTNSKSLTQKVSLSTTSTPNATHSESIKMNKTTSTTSAPMSEPTTIPTTPEPSVKTSDPPKPITITTTTTTPPNSKDENSTVTDSSASSSDNSTTDAKMSMNNTESILKSDSKSVSNVTTTPSPESTTMGLLDSLINVKITQSIGLESNSRPEVVATTAKTTIDYNESPSSTPPTETKPSASSQILISNVTDVPELTRADDNQTIDGKLESNKTLPITSSSNATSSSNLVQIAAEPANATSNMPATPTEAPKSTESNSIKMVTLKPHPTEQAPSSETIATPMAAPELPKATSPKPEITATVTPAEPTTKDIAPSETIVDKSDHSFDISPNISSVGVKSGQDVPLPTLNSPVTSSNNDSPDYITTTTQIPTITTMATSLNFTLNSTATGAISNEEAGAIALSDGGAHSAASLLGTNNSSNSSGLATITQTAIATPTPTPAGLANEDRTKWPVSESGRGAELSHDEPKGGNSIDLVQLNYGGSISNLPALAQSTGVINSSSTPAPIELEPATQAQISLLINSADSDTTPGGNKSSLGGEPAPSSTTATPLTLLSALLPISTLSLLHQTRPNSTLVATTERPKSSIVPAEYYSTLDLARDQQKSQLTANNKTWPVGTTIEPPNQQQSATNTNKMSQGARFTADTNNSSLTLNSNYHDQQSNVSTPTNVLSLNSSPSDVQHKAYGSNLHTISQVNVSSHANTSSGRPLATARAFQHHDTRPHANNTRPHSHLHSNSTNSGSTSRQNSHRHSVSSNHTIGRTNHSLPASNLSSNHQSSHSAHQTLIIPHKLKTHLGGQKHATSNRHNTTNHTLSSLANNNNTMAHHNQTKPVIQNIRVRRAGSLNNRRFARYLANNNQDLEPDTKLEVLAICRYIPNANVLREAIRGFRGHQISYFVIDTSKVPPFPNDLFEGVDVRWLEISNSTLQFQNNYLRSRHLAPPGAN